jgi:hypothetical protein
MFRLLNNYSDFSPDMFIPINDQVKVCNCSSRPFELSLYLSAMQYKDDSLGRDIAYALRKDSQVEEQKDMAAEIVIYGGRTRKSGRHSAWHGGKDEDERISPVNGITLPEMISIGNENTKEKTGRGI